MNTKKTHLLWIASAMTLTVLIGVTVAVVKERAGKNDANASSSAARETNASASPLRNPTASGLPTFSSLGIHEFTRTVIKGLPLSATVVMERVQTSADGNSTTRIEIAKVYRDGQGRTRYDEMGEAKGAEAPTVEDPLQTTINDPATGVSFVVDPKTHTARRKAFVAQTESGSDDLRKSAASTAPPKQKSPNSQVLPVPSMNMDQGLKNPPATSSPNAQRESLGRRQVEGLMADGTRIVMTVPAGTRNNEKEIRIGCERWYSSSLKTLILIECSDSRYGKSSYRLTQIKTEEPAANLFTIPIEYKVQE